MDFGVIKRAGGPIEPEEWKRVIAAHSALQPIPPRTGINPFTKEPVLFHAPDGAAYYFEDGQKVGNLALEEGEIKTTGVPAAVCEEIAAALSAELHEGDRS